MDRWQLLLLFLAMAVATTSAAVRNWRGVTWVVVGAANFVITAAYEAWGLPYHPFVTGLFDASVCVAIYFFGVFRWELALFLVYQLSVLVGILSLAGLTGDHYWYIVALEFCNYLALIVIWSGSVAQMVGDGTPSSWGARGRVYRAVWALLAPDRASGSPPEA